MIINFKITIIKEKLIATHSRALSLPYIELRVVILLRNFINLQKKKEKNPILNGSKVGILKLTTYYGTRFLV
jgi:hypothetical protein